MSRRIREMRRIVVGMQPEVDAAIERELGGTFFIDRPTPQRLANWRSKAQSAAARAAGFAYSAYGHQNLSGVVDALADALLPGAGEAVGPTWESVGTVDRQAVGEGKCGSGRVGDGGRVCIKKKKERITNL